MSNTNANSAEAGQPATGHRLTLEEHEKIAIVLASAWTQDAIANGQLDRIPIFSDVLRSSKALGRGPSFALSLRAVLGLGQREMQSLPSAEEWERICNLPYLIRLRRELCEELSSSTTWIRPVLSGTLPVDHFKAPPLSPDNFSRDLSIVQGHFTTRGSMLKSLATLGDVDLKAHLDAVSLGRSVDIEEINTVEKLALERIMACRAGLFVALREAILQSVPADWRDTKRWQLISLVPQFEEWRRVLTGDLLKIAIAHGARGQSDPFELPEFDITSLDRPEWKASWRLPWASRWRGAALTSAGAAAGATAGGAAAGSSGASALTTCVVTTAKCTTAAKVFGLATAGGGLAAGALALTIWAYSTYSKATAAKAYADFVIGLVEVIEAAVLADFMSRFRAYYGRITYPDDMQAQAALEERLQAAMHRLAAANVYAQAPDVEQRRKGFTVVD